MHCTGLELLCFGLLLPLPPDSENGGSNFETSAMQGGESSTDRRVGRDVTILSCARLRVYQP